MSMRVLSALFFCATSAFVFGEARADAASTVRTLVRCEEGEGDQWLEIGISRSLVAYVVLRNEDDGSAKLILRERVSMTSRDDQTIYEDEAETFRLTVRRRGTFLTGTLSAFGSEGPNRLDLNRRGLDCFLNGSIQFDKN